MNIITPQELRDIADGIENSNHAAEVAQARISYALSLREPKEPEGKDRVCCSEYLNGQWVSTGCTCGNSDDAEMAEWWRHQMNDWLLYQKYCLACTSGEDL